MVKVNIFDYDDYKAFLLAVLPKKGQRTGQRSALARFVGCQTAYISQVLNGRADLSSEQAYLTTQFLQLNDLESKAFLLLVQKARSGNHEYTLYLDRRWLELHKQHTELKQRLSSTTEVSEKVQSQYYSSWYYLAIHMLLSIDKFQTAQAIVEHLQLELQLVNKVLDFLVKNGMATEANGRYSIGEVHIHLSRHSQHIFKHQSNLRLKALQSLDYLHERNDVHYSVVYSLSRKDAEKIKNQITKLIEDNLKRIQPSEPEVLYCNVIDFFEVKS